MDIDQITSSLSRLHPLQSAAFTFNEQGMTGLFRLHGLLEGCPLLSITKYEKAVLIAVCTSRDWGCTQNRTYNISGLGHETIDTTLLREILKDVDKVEVEHGAKEMLSRRQKRREEASQQILNTVLTNDLQAEVREWGLSISGCLSKLHDGTPALFFFMEAKGTGSVTITLDAFSGRMAINGVYADGLYLRPEHLQEVILEAMQDFLETATN